MNKRPFDPNARKALQLFKEEMSNELVQAYNSEHNNDYYLEGLDMYVAGNYEDNLKTILEDSETNGDS